MGADIMEKELPDTAEGMERKDTANTVPTGWLVLFFGLIAWGAWYLWSYSPWSTGWTPSTSSMSRSTGVASCCWTCWDGRSRTHGGR